MYYCSIAKLAYSRTIESLYSKLSSKEVIIYF